MFLNNEVKMFWMFLQWHFHNVKEELSIIIIVAFYGHPLYLVVLGIIGFFSAFLWNLSLWLDRLSGDGSLPHLVQPCLVALGRALICMVVSRMTFCCRPLQGICYCCVWLGWVDLGLHTIPMLGSWLFIAICGNEAIQLLLSSPSPSHEKHLYK